MREVITGIREVGQQRFPEAEQVERGRRAGYGVEAVTRLCAAMPRTVEDVELELGCGRTASYRHVARAIEAGLVERRRLLTSSPALVVATRDGHRFAGTGLRPVRISPGSVNHWQLCSRFAWELRGEFAGVAILSEAELRLKEEIAGRALASAVVGLLPGGSDRLHRPDLVVAMHPKPIAVEVELSPKAPARLRAIIRGWRRASCVASTIYLCRPGATLAGVTAAVRRERADDRVEIKKITRT